MSTLAKLAGFAAGVSLLFGAAALAGGAVGPLRDEPDAKTADAHAGGDMRSGEMTPQDVRGLAISDDGLALALARTTAPRGKRIDLTFRIADGRGRTVRDFDVEHTKRMHLIVVRRDMTGFQHLHPRQRADGTWTVPVVLRDAGAYRVFADFSVAGRPRTLAADLTVDGEIRSRPLPRPRTTATVDGLEVRLDRDGSELAFTVTRDRRPVAVEDYLGAKGHLVALRAGDLAFLHVHPDEERLRFMAELPTPGAYRLFLQFKVDGRVHTAEFTREVS